MSISAISSNILTTVNKQPVVSSFTKTALKVAAVALAALAALAVIGACLHPVGATFAAGMLAALITYKFIAIPLGAVGALSLVSIPLKALCEKVKAFFQKNQPAIDPPEPNHASLKDSFINLCENQSLLTETSYKILSGSIKRAPNKFDLKISEDFLGTVGELRNLEKVSPHVILEKNPIYAPRLEILKKSEYTLPKIPSTFFQDSIERDLQLNSVELSNGTTIACDSSEHEEVKLKKSIQIVRDIRKFVKATFPDKAKSYQEKISNVLLHYCSQQFYASIDMASSTLNIFILTQGIQNRAETNFDLKFEQIASETGEAKIKATLVAKQTQKVSFDDGTTYNDFAKLDFKFSHTFNIPKEADKFIANLEQHIEAATVEIL